MAELPLTVQEMKIPRHPVALLDWCVSKIEEIAALEKGTQSIRFGKGLCKVLTEEVYPLARWATTAEHVPPDAWIAPQIGSQQFDAMVHSPDSDPQDYFVEVTQAHMGQSEHFRMLHLEQKGWAPGPLSGVERVGGRGSNFMRPGRVMTSGDERISKTKGLVLKALENKIFKSYEPPTVLVVAFEDLILKTDDTAFGQVMAAAVTYLAEVAHPFFRVYLVGTAGRLTGCVYDES